MLRRSQSRALAALAVIGGSALGGVHAATAGPGVGTGPAGVAVAATRAAAVGAHPDFNGDGYSDIVIASIDERVDSKISAGAVFVIPGSRWGPQVMHTQRWSQNSPGIYGTAETGDWFGGGWATGDFDGDGYDDLAVGAGGEDLAGVDGAGVIHVIYGSADGLTAAGNRTVSQASEGVPGDPAAGDGLGRGDMAAGDFDGDGYDDLAAPITGDEVGLHDDAGGVLVLRGSRWGLTRSGSQLFTQDSPGIIGVAEAGDSWSYGGMTTGDWNGDGLDDLFVSAAMEDLGALSHAGGFHVLYGHSSGLRGQGSGFFTAASGDIPGDPAAGTWLGFGHPAAADVDGDGLDDLAFPWSYAPVTVGGAVRPRAGIVMILHGHASGLSADGTTVWSQQTPGIPGWSTTNGYWGFFSVVAGDFDRDHNVDLAVGAAGELASGKPSAGALYVIQTDGRENIRRVTRIDEDDPGLQGATGSNYFTDGLLVAGDWNGDGNDDLAAAAPGYDLPGANNAGGVYLFSGRRWTALSPDTARFLTQDSPGIPSYAEASEWFALCCY